MLAVAHADARPSPRSSFLGYLASKGVYPLGHAKIFKVAVWSCRAWAAYVALSLLALHRDRLAFRKQAASLCRSPPVRLAEATANH
jgi:hypothetical protein